MPKLLQINSTANWGSTGRIAEQIGERAIAAGWESYIAYGRNAQPSKSQLIKIGSRIGVLWHVLMSRLFDCHGLASRFATKRLIKQIKAINPDIIHLHNIHGYYLNYRMLFEYLQTISTPIVWTLHDCWSFTGHCAYFDALGCDRWKTGCHHCPGLRTYPKAKFADNSKGNYELKKRLFTSLANRITLVPVSGWLGEFVEESFLADCGVRVIRNGIDIGTFAPQSDVVKREGLNGRKIILGVAATWSARKGLSDFLKLRQMLPMDKYAIVLIGLDEEQLASLPEGVVGFRRTQCARELTEWYSVADVFLNPTYEDNYPTTNLEAIACGTPVVTYRTGGSPESITEQTGIVLEQGDLEAVRTAIETICSNGKAPYAEACRKYAEQHFDKDKCFEQYIGLYNEIINNTK